jgi:hypothetical protein
VGTQLKESLLDNINSLKSSVEELTVLHIWLLILKVKIMFASRFIKVKMLKLSKHQLINQLKQPKQNFSMKTFYYTLELAME